MNNTYSLSQVADQCEISRAYLLQTLMHASLIIHKPKEGHKVTPAGKQFGLLNTQTNRHSAVHFTPDAREKILTMAHESSQSEKNKTLRKSSC